MLPVEAITTHPNHTLPTDYFGPWHLWVVDTAGALVLVASAHDITTALRVAQEVAADFAGRSVAIAYPYDPHPVQEFGGVRTKLGR